MSVEDKLRAEIAALKELVADLQRRAVFDRRLGPQPDTPEEIAGSTYLVTHRMWVDWMEQCLSRGREYVISLEEARRYYPNPSSYHGGSTNIFLAY